MTKNRRFFDCHEWLAIHNMRRGQSSLELFITLGIVLAFTVPVLFLLLSITSVGYEKTSIAQAEASARSLSDTMNFVYAQGPGAKKLMLLNVPASTEEIYANGTLNEPGGEAVVRLKTASGRFDAVSPTFAKISGGAQTAGQKTGLFVLCVKNTNGAVELSVSLPC